MTSVLSVIHVNTRRENSTIHRFAADDSETMNRPRPAMRRVAFHQSKLALRGPRPEQLALADGLFEVCDQVIGMFDADGDPNGFLTDSRCPAGFLRHGGMAHGIGVFD